MWQRREEREQSSVSTGQRLRFARQRAGKTLYRAPRRCAVCKYTDDSETRCITVLKEEGKWTRSCIPCTYIDIVDDRRTRLVSGGHVTACSSHLVNDPLPSKSRLPRTLRRMHLSHPSFSGRYYSDAIPLPRKRPESPYSIRSKPRMTARRNRRGELLLLNGIGAGKQRVMMVCNMEHAAICWSLLSVRTDIVLIGNSRRHFLGCVSQSGTSGTDGRADSVG
ncbi:hypothetical protein KC359_g52 [Hortaea werneckii]|nr:hypothetical protein KC359_g52 [Hortaea werneckii]